ncbi:MAG TPA: peptidoglycan DD-metalloendopeptidase family protein [Bacillota bacterium]|jgi:murein DD-endopeptidase MepM/ murein hydrolase activator NlpD
MTTSPAGPKRQSDLKLPATGARVVGLKRLVAGFVLAAMVLAPATVFGAGTGNVKDAQDQLDKINQQIQDKQRQLGTVQSRKNQVRNEINRITSQLQRTSRDLVSLQKQMTQTEKDIAQAQAELSVAEADLGKRRGFIDTRVRALYENGSVNYLEVLLGSRDFSDFLNRFDLLSQVIAKDVEIYGQIRTTRQLVSDKKAALEDKQAQLTGLKKQTEVKKASLDDSESERQKALKELATLENGLEDDLEALEKASNELADFIRANSNETGLATDRSQISLAWPVPPARITSPYGYRYHPILRTRRLHTGIDIASPSGTPIKAAESGRVMMARYNSVYGYMVMIEHGAGVVTLYAHQQNRLQVKEGDLVKKGQLLGYVGSTGWSTGPHLHFEVRVNGNPVSPTSWLPAR